MMRLILVRHGETIWNTQRRLQGHTDIPLSETGRQQARATARRLANDPVAAIYASDLQRASETAAIIAASLNLPVRPDPRLREQSKGVWESLTWDEIVARYPAETAQWQTDSSFRPPGGEGLREVAARVAAALADIRAACPGQRVVIVGHGMALRTLICLALEIDPAQEWRFPMDNAAITELRYTPEGAALARLNDTCHVLAGEDQPSAGKRGGTLGPITDEPHAAG
jgi:alpha-ribazole phosphatase